MDTNELVEFLDSRFHKGYAVLDEDGDIEARWITSSGLVYLYQDAEKYHLSFLTHRGKFIYSEAFTEARGISNRSVERLLYLVKREHWIKRLYPMQLKLEKLAIFIANKARRKQY